jgi:periplasmic copper chaperone A
MIRRRSRVAAGVCMLAVAGGVVMMPGSALAHVSVDPDTAEAGGYATLAFRVPNERDDASTTRLEVVFPRDSPLGHASVKPIPGWTSTTTMKKLATPIRSGDSEITEAPSSIVWKGGSIGAGEFQEFEISTGRLPDDAGTLAFKAVQTYSNGEVVRWIEIPSAGGAEPEHPAPMLTVAPPEAATGDVPGEAESTGDERPNAGVGADSAAGLSELVATRDPAARWLAGIGMVAGLVALGVAVLRRRPAAAHAQTSSSASNGAEATRTEATRTEEPAKARR